MKHKLSFCLVIMALLSLFINGVNAQEHQKAFRIGPRVGLSVNDMKFKWHSDSENAFFGGNYTNLELRWNVGIAVEYDFLTKDRFVLSGRFTPQFKQKGCYFYGYYNFSNDHTHSMIIFDYLDFPIEACAKFRVSGKNYLTLGFGPTFNIGINHVHKNNAGVLDRFQFGEGEGRNYLHRLDVGAMASIGFEHRFGLRYGSEYFIPIRNLSINKSYSVQFFQAGFYVGYMF